MKRVLARIRRAVVPARATTRTFRADYEDETLWQAFALSPRAQGSKCLRRGLDAFERGQHADAIPLGVRHFENQANSRFFANPKRLHGSCDPVFEKSLQHAIAWSRDASHMGLRIYDRRGPLLRADFPWNDPLGMRESDLLFAVHPQRFAFLPAVALATSVGANPPTHLVTLLDGWMEFARVDRDLAFCSNLVVIQRMLASIWAFFYLGIAEREHEVRWRILKIIGQDIDFLVPRLGNSYPNNHLLLDRFAAWFIALLFPEWLRHDPDIDETERIWLEELFRQTYDDGGGVEHCTHYHGLAAEMATAYLLLAERNRRPVSASHRKRIGRMLDLQAALCGTDGYATPIGDSSDDSLFPLDGVVGGNAMALREVHRAMFASGRASATKDSPGRTRAWWLLGGRLAAPTSGTTAAAQFIALAHGGIVVFSDDREATRCTFRLGPMRGTRYLPGHQHADALSVTVTKDGVPFLVDAGTCTYRFRRADESPEGVNWRAYFAGGEAHNGLVIDGDYPIGRMVGDFRAMNCLPEVSTIASGAGREIAFHEAQLCRYGSFPDWSRGVIHLPGIGFVVYDIIIGSKCHAPRHFAFQCASHCETYPAGDRQVDVRTHGAVLRFAWSTGLGTPDIVCGRVYPTNGWVSPAYGERLAAPQILVPFEHASGLTAFALGVYGSTRSLRIECERGSGSARIFRLMHDDGIELVLLNSGSVNEPVMADEIAFEGRIAWIRIPHGGRPSVRWLEGRSLSAPRWSVRHAFSQLVPEFAG